MRVRRDELNSIVFGSSLSEASAAVPAANWQSEWEGTVEAAKKEGQVAVYLKVGYDLVFGAFQKKYPEIKVNSIAGQTADITNGLIADRRADKHMTDVFSFGVRPTQSLLKINALEPIRPYFVLPEVLDESKWYEGHVYSDSGNTHIFRYLSVAEQQIGLNTSLIKDQRKEFRSYWDLLNPKWKGKIVARDVRTAGPGSGKLGPTFMKRVLGEMDITMTRYSRQATDWLALGKFAICSFCSEDVEIGKRQGLPIDSLDVDWKEATALVSQSGNLAILKNAPHPNAAKVFVNWFLAREGQAELQILAKVQSAESRRSDIPKDDVLSDVRRKPGEKYLDLDSRAEWSDMEPIRKLLNEILKDTKK